MIKPISECYIRPKQDEEQPYYYLEPTGLVFLDYFYIQNGLLYTKPPSFNIHSFNNKLQRALSHTLVHFYPLAGRFVTARCDDECACWIYVDCNKGPGARFIHASHDTATVADVVSSDPDMIPVIHSFFELGEKDIVNHDGHTRALVSVQVTELVDGVFIGFSVNHSVADGSSYFHFLDTLSEIFRQITDDDDDDDNNNEGKMMISQVPLILNPIFPDNIGPIIKLPYPNQLIINRPKAKAKLCVRQRVFYFSPTSVTRLKVLVNSDAEPTRTQISSFQSVCALLWRSINRARNLGPEVIATMTLVADTRARYDPQLSSEHFGNMLMGIQASSKVDDLLGNGLGWAAMILNKAVVAVDEEAALDCHRIALQTILKGQSFLYPAHIDDQVSDISVGGSTRFDIYGPEFGLGKAVAVRTGCSEKEDGFVRACPGFEGGGGIELDVCLKPDVMSALELDEEFMSYVS